MRDIIGSAQEFYRLRIVTVDVSDAPDLEWREDILWRRPAADGVGECILQRLEAVALADAETAWTLGEFATTSEAHAALEEVNLDLADMTKSQFEEAHLHGDAVKAATSTLSARTIPEDAD